MNVLILYPRKKKHRKTHEWFLLILSLHMLTNVDFLNRQMLAFFFRSALSQFLSIKIFDDFPVVQKRRTADFEASKLVKGFVGLAEHFPMLDPTNTSIGEI